MSYQSYLLVYCIQLHGELMSYIVSTSVLLSVCALLAELVGRSKKLPAVFITEEESRLCLRMH